MGILFQPWPENEAEQDRCWFEAWLQQSITKAPNTKVAGTSTIWLRANAGLAEVLVPASYVAVAYLTVTEALELVADWWISTH